MDKTIRLFLNQSPALGERARDMRVFRVRADFNMWSLSCQLYLGAGPHQQDAQAMAHKFGYDEGMWHLMRDDFAVFLQGFAVLPIYQLAMKENFARLRKYYEDALAGVTAEEEPLLQIPVPISITAIMHFDGWHARSTIGNTPGTYNDPPADRAGSVMSALRMGKENGEERSIVVSTHAERKDTEDRAWDTCRAMFSWLRGQEGP